MYTNRKEKQTLIVIGVLVFVMAATYIGSMLHMSPSITNRFCSRQDFRDYQLWATYPVYSVTAPFGVFQLKGDAVFLSGTELYTEEVYVTKYTDGNELKTVTLEATTHPIIVDGTFKLEEYRPARYTINPDGSTTILDWEEYGWFNPIKFKLHLPGLPEPALNMTIWYIDGVG